jgi:nitrate reductase NapE component
MAPHEDFSRTHGIKTSSNRGFGWVFTVVFLVIGLWPLLSGGTVRRWSLITAAVVVVITLTAPALLALPNRLWLRFGLLLNRLTSPVVLAFLFYVVVTPMGLLMRLFGKDSLRLRASDADGSYWIQRDPPGPKPESLHHQF